MFDPEDDALVEEQDATGSDFEAAEFSTLHLRDRVVIMALFDQIVTEQQIHALWRVRQHQLLPFAKEPFWRLMTLLPQVDLDLVYEEAARVAGIDNAYISMWKSVKMVRAVASAVPPRIWQDMVSLPVLPIDEEEGRPGEGKTLICASHDPTNPLIPRILGQVHRGRNEMRFAPIKDLRALLHEALPPNEGQESVG